MSTPGVLGLDEGRSWARAMRAIPARAIVTLRAMVRACLSLVVLAFCLGVPLAWVVRGVSRRLHAVDSPGVPGQVKAARRWVPNTGGVAVVLAFAVPVVGVLLMVGGMDPAAGAPWRSDLTFLPADLHEHVAGLRQQTPLAWLVLACVAVLHVLGLIDDRRPMGPWIKLAIMALPAVAIPLLPELTATRLPQTRLLTLLDAPLGGAWASVALTATWFLVLTNAMNFLDNMDGLAAGVGAAASACLLAVALHAQQWFVAACLALLLGSLLGFLVFNFPWREWNGQRGGASLFLGDGGSLVVGFLLAFLSTRITYVPHVPAPGAVLGNAIGPGGTPWHAIFTPLVVLAVPLYDFTSVVLIRLSQGRSPFVGDLQHLSHRIEQKGLTRRQAVLVIYLFALGGGLAGVILPRVGAGEAKLIFAQVAAMLAALALFEWSHARKKGVA